jgi:hypothetical protein
MLILLLISDFLVVTSLINFIYTVGRVGSFRFLYYTHYCFIIIIIVIIIIVAADLSIYMED